MKTILAITALTDENQFSDLICSIEKQIGVEVIHKVIRNQDALGAEREIYRIAREFRSSVDYIIRLDADMVIISKKFFYFLSIFFEKFPRINRLSLPVEDFFTDEQIMGVHCWRASSTPESVAIVPPKPEAWIDFISGVNFTRIAIGVVKHAWSPSCSQAARFGLHRAIKATMYGPTHGHWMTLYRLYGNWLKNPSDEGLCYAFYSALFAISSSSRQDWSLLSKGTVENDKLLRDVSYLVSTEFPLKDIIGYFGFYRIFKLAGGNLTQYLYLHMKIVVKKARMAISLLKWSNLSAQLRREEFTIGRLLGDQV